MCVNLVILFEPPATLSRVALLVKLLGPGENVLNACRVREMHRASGHLRRERNTTRLLVFSSYSVFVCAPCAEMALFPIGATSFLKIDSEWGSSVQEMKKTPARPMSQLIEKPGVICQSG